MESKKIKTKTEYKPVKTLDKSALIGQRMKAAFIRTKKASLQDNARQSEGANPNHYAEERVQIYTEEAGKLASAMGKSVHAKGRELFRRRVKNNVQRKRDAVEDVAVSFDFADAPPAYLSEVFSSSGDGSPLYIEKPLSEIGVKHRVPNSYRAVNRQEPVHVTEGRKLTISGKQKESMRTKRGCLCGTAQKTPEFDRKETSPPLTAKDTAPAKPSCPAAKPPTFQVEGRSATNMRIKNPPSSRKRMKVKFSKFCHKHDVRLFPQKSAKSPEIKNSDISTGISSAVHPVKQAEKSTQPFSFRPLKLSSDTAIIPNPISKCAPTPSQSRQAVQQRAQRTNLYKMREPSSLSKIANRKKFSMPKIRTPAIATLKPPLNVKRQFSPLTHQARKRLISTAKATASVGKSLSCFLAAGSGAVVLIILITVMLGSALSFMGNPDNANHTPVSAEVEAFEPIIRAYTTEYGIPEYVELVKAVMMQESGGNTALVGGDVMQCAEGMGLPVGTAVDTNESIRFGISILADNLRVAGATGPMDIPKISLALQGYNFGNGYISWALVRGGYSKANAREFSEMQAAAHGWSGYGDVNYVDHVLRYYSFGISPLGGASAVADGRLAYPFPGHSWDTYSGHNGIDISFANCYGEPVYAVGAGTVRYTQDGWTAADGVGGMWSFGNAVFIDHGDGWISAYGHLSAVAVRKGEHIAQGQLLGYVGSTGNSTGPHLHLALYLDGDAGVNGRNYAELAWPQFRE